MDGKSDRAAILHQFVSIDWGWAMAVIVICVSNNIVVACRFLLIVRRAASTHVGLWSALKANFAGIFLGSWTPLSIAGDGGRVLWLRNGVVESYKDAMLVVLWDRLIALIALVVFMVPFTPYYVGRIVDYFHVSVASVIATGVAGLALVLMFTAGQRGKLRMPV